MRIRWPRRAAGVSAAMLLVLALVAAGEGASADIGPGGAVPLEERHLPTAVNAPGTWSGAEGVRGPVAALGIATRTEAVELFESKASLRVFAVSAVDGGASWLRLPGFSLDRWGFIGGFAVSPDGQWIGWVRPQRSRRGGAAGRVAGWSVMDTTTGRIRRLEVPGFPWVHGTLADLAFSGDSRHLLTSYESPDRLKRSAAHQFVAWDVQDGAPTVIEEPGQRWLPDLGSAPSGVVWARGRQVFRVDPDAGDRTVVTLPQKVVTASWGPDDESFAYIGYAGRPRAPWRLYAGRTVADARGRPVDLPSGIEVGEVLGWRDATHVVVGHHRRTVYVVDVVTGEVEAIDLSGYGEQVNAPYLAGDLWQQALLTPVPPDGTTDPRRPWRWVSGLLVLSGAVLLVLWRRRSRPRRGLAPPAEQRRVDPAYDGSLSHPRPWRPLSRAATGLILVIADLRVPDLLDLRDLDVLPDPLGWAMAASALSSLQAAHRGFQVAGVAAWLAVIPALPEWFGVENLLITTSEEVALLVVQVATCTAVMAVIPARASSAAAIRWLTVGLSGALVLALAAAAAEPRAGILALAIGLAELGVAVWFLVLLYGGAHEAPTSVAAHPAGAP